VKIFGTFRQAAGPPAGDDIEHRNRQKRARENDHFPFEKRLPDAGILRRAIAPSPNTPLERLVQRECRPTRDWPPKGVLIGEAHGDVLRRQCAEQQQQAQAA
jgi:hypothetical protein